MRSLYMVRHAKSSWETTDIPDFDRPLNERGRKDAVEMARRLEHRGVKINVFISSPARRAKKTARIFAEQFGFDPDQIILAESLYLASESIFYEIISSMDDKYKHMAIFSHNPGITEFVNTLCEGIRTDNMPTASIFGIETDAKKWSDFRLSPKKFLFFDYPKQLS